MIKLTPFGRRLLRQVKARILMYPEKFNMDHYVEHDRKRKRRRNEPANLCGTTACIAGHASIMMGTPPADDFLIPKDSLRARFDQAGVPQKVIPKLLKFCAKEIEDHVDLYEDYCDGRRNDYIQRRPHHVFVSMNNLASEAIFAPGSKGKSNNVFLASEWPEPFRARYHDVEARNNPKLLSQIAAERIDHLLKHGQ